jgi:hypothetical protein
MEFQLAEAKRWRTTVLAPWKEHNDGDGDEPQANEARGARNLNNNNINSNNMPPLTICSSVTVPTPNQILRRKKQQRRQNDSDFSAGQTRDDYEDKGKSSNRNKTIDNYESFPRSLLSLWEAGRDRIGGGDSWPPIIQNSISSASSCSSSSSRWEYDYASGRTVPGDGRIDYSKSFPPEGTSFSTVDLSSVHSKQFCWEDTGGDLGTVWQAVNQQLSDYYNNNNNNDEYSHIESPTGTTITTTRSAKTTVSGSSPR